MLPSGLGTNQSRRVTAAPQVMYYIHLPQIFLKTIPGSAGVLKDIGFICLSLRKKFHWAKYRLYLLEEWWVHGVAIQICMSVLNNHFENFQLNHINLINTYV